MTPVILQTLYILTMHFTLVIDVAPHYTLHKNSPNHELGPII